MSSPTGDPERDGVRDGSRGGSATPRDTLRARVARTFLDLVTLIRQLDAVHQEIADHQRRGGW